jgi:hypothetical protein
MTIPVKVRSQIVKLREAWQHPTLGRVLLGIAVLLFTVWLFRTPPPNYSVIVMAVAAALMALRPDMSGTEKWLWAAVLLAFAVVEIRAIKLDRAVHDREQFNAALEQARHFQTIADGLKDSISKSDQHFDDTMSGVRGLISLEAGVSNTARQSLERITGGNAFCFLIPTQLEGSLIDFDLSVGTSGKVMLPSCDVRIVENILPGDSPEVANRQFFTRGLNVTRIQALLDGVTTTGYIIQAGPHRSYQMILTSPTRQVREDISFSEVPNRPGWYAPTCKVYSFDAKSQLLKDGCDTKRPTNK